MGMIHLPLFESSLFNPLIEGHHNEKTDRCSDRWPVRRFRIRYFRFGSGFGIGCRFGTGFCFGIGKSKES